MEIRCSECGYLGEAGGVRPVDGGVGLVCAECDHVNVVAASGDDEAGWAQTPSDDEEGARFDLGDVQGADSGVDNTGEDGGGSELPSVQRLRPQPGEGPRCRKCAHLFETEDVEHCARCGLSVEEADKFEKGQAPWERPPEGLEEAHRAACELWQAALDDDEEVTFDAFADLVIEEGLIDFGMRRVQHYLVDHPDDEDAIRALRRLAQGLEVAMKMARTRAESKAEEFNDDVKRARTGLLVAALIFWVAIFLLFSWLFLGNV